MSVSCFAISYRTVSLCNAGQLSGDSIATPSTDQRNRKLWWKLIWDQIVKSFHLQHSVSLSGHKGQRGKGKMRERLGKGGGAKTCMASDRESFDFAIRRWYVVAHSVVDCFWQLAAVRHAESRHSYIALWLWSTKHTVNWKFDYQSNCFGTTTLSVNQNNILIISSHRVLGLFSLTQIAALLLTLWLVNRMHIRVDWYSNGGF